MAHQEGEGVGDEARFKSSLAPRLISRMVLDEVVDRYIKAEAADIDRKIVAPRGGSTQEAIREYIEALRNERTAAEAAGRVLAGVHAGRTEIMGWSDDLATE